MTSAIYPKRPQFFAHKFCRLLAKKTVANEIGAAGCWLLTVIAMTEDARGYTDPVTFYNGQLAPLLGINSDDTLDRVRAKCVTAGWLHYEPGARGRAGRYFVTVPEEHTGTDDAPTDEGESGELIRKTADDEQENIRKTAEQSGRNVRMNPESMCGTLFPVPSPVPVAGSAPAAPTPEKKPRRQRPRNLLFDALEDVTGSDPVVNGSHVGKVADLLLKANPPYTPDDVRAFAGCWRELLPWAKPAEHPRLTLGIIQKHIPALRAATRAAAEVPRIKRAEDNPAFQDQTEFAPA